MMDSLNKHKSLYEAVLNGGNVDAIPEGTKYFSELKETVEKFNELENEIGDFKGLALTYDPVSLEPTGNVFLDTIFSLIGQDSNKRMNSLDKILNSIIEDISEKSISKFRDSDIESFASALDSSQNI